MWTKYNTNDQSYDVLDADNNLFGFVFRIEDRWSGITTEGYLTDNYFTIRQAARAVEALRKYRSI